MKTPSLMIQGTSSNAGKSLLCAALCRIFHQDGYRVAPFKAQNMSLNSFVSERGEEMGRAQVLQAQACRRVPDARMNPILIKPNSERGSQIMSMGRPVGNMSIAEYTAYKPQAFATACAAYDDLCRESDLVILEGAGSPAEVNLKKDDIVNMRMAQVAQSPVLVVGDIDRGGVFASFIGTYHILENWERELLKGFVVNKFRGDASLLDSAFQYILDHTGKRVLGPVPYMLDLGLPEEDSVGFREQQVSASPNLNKANMILNHADEINSVKPSKLKLVLVDLPHISNFSDFDALKIEEDVAWRIAQQPSDCLGADVIFIPGSKNTCADLQALKNKGFAGAIQQALLQGAEIVGLCAGMQMLGKSIADPHGLESASLREEGLGLLDLDTVMASDKFLQQSWATHLPTGIKLKGYQIHHGVTQYREKALMVEASNDIVGCCSSNGRVWGTYLHGVFDSDQFRHAWLNALRLKNGLSPKLGRIYDHEASLDRLATGVRSSLDMDFIRSLLRRP